MTLCPPFFNNNNNKRKHYYWKFSLFWGRQLERVRIFLASCKKLQQTMGHVEVHHVMGHNVHHVMGHILYSSAPYDGASHE